ncbi:Transcription factor MYB44 [Linum perenne]
MPASSTDEQTIPSKNHLNSTLKRKCGGTSADGQPPLKRSDGLCTGSNFSDLYLNRSSPSGSDLMRGNDSSPVYRPLARTSSLIPPNLSMDVSSSIRDPITSLSLSLPGSDPPETDSGPACRICSRIVCSSCGCSNITTAITIDSCVTASSDDSARAT